MGKATIRHRLAELYLENEQVSNISLVAYDHYKEECPPLFPESIKISKASCPLTEEEIQLLDMGNHYRVVESNDVHFLTDNFTTNECYHNRQYMLFSAYRYLLGDLSHEHSLLDIAGGHGYYSLQASRLGFRPVLCLEGHKEYTSAFSLLKQHLPMLDVAFNLMNVEKLDTLQNQQFDIVLAQGILHHIYDHCSFVRQLFRLTRKGLIVDTHLNARMDATLDMWMEDPYNLRDSPHTGISLCPSLTVLVELLKLAGFRTIFRILYPGKVKGEDGSVKDVYRYRSLRRIMLVAIP